MGGEGLEDVGDFNGCYAAGGCEEEVGFLIVVGGGEKGCAEGGEFGVGG